MTVFSVLLSGILSFNFVLLEKVSVPKVVYTKFTTGRHKNTQRTHNCIFGWQPGENGNSVYSFNAICELKLKALLLFSVCWVYLCRTFTFTARNAAVIPGNDFWISHLFLSCSSRTFQRETYSLSFFDSMIRFRTDNQIFTESKREHWKQPMCVFRQTFFPS